MDFQAFVDQFDPMTCVISVEALPGGRYGEIRLVAGNKAYVDSIETVWDGPQLLSNKFVPGSLYQNYFPKDLNFERVCYRAAVEKDPVHTYVHPDRFDFWFNLFLLPLKNEGNLYYCTYTQEVTHKPDTKEMSNISSDTARAVLNTCIKLHGAKDLDESIKEVIKDIRDICGAWACTILLINKQEKTCKVLAEQRKDPSQAQTRRTILNEEPNFYAIAERWEETIGGSSCLIVRNESDMEYIREKHPEWYQSLCNHGVTSIVLFPLKSGDEVLGYIWATNFDTDKTDHIKEVMELTTYFVTSEVANDLLVKRLKIMSSVDMLTGVQNRNEMNNRIDRISHGEIHIKNLGIVFADLNGLKRVNDDNGHISGDVLLQNAAEVLKSIFTMNNIFRAGGDEFMVIVPDTTEEALEAKAEKVRASSLGFDAASFAVGWCFVEDSKDIFKALHISDERMYEDKEKYYQKHPELKR
ncbi:MAG: GGDEF domain-containing protein [Lachnospiraceae bacterium]|nr:GGDEF domain-containing protein [Lachnospiraceae bacterium]